MTGDSSREASGFLMYMVVVSEKKYAIWNSSTFQSIVLGVPKKNDIKQALESKDYSENELRSSRGLRRIKLETSGF